MKWMLAAALVAMTGCAIDDPVEPETDSDPVADPRAVGDESATRLAIHLVDCMPAMTVAGNAPYSVQCAVAYSVSEAGVQIAYDATDASGNVWVSARAAAPMSSVPDSHGFTVFALESMTAPAIGGLRVRTKLVDAAQTMTSDEISATIVVRN